MRGIACHSDGIYTVESDFADQHRLVAIHLIIDNGRVAIIDTGSNASVPLILAALARLNVVPEAVDWIVLTHMHLDHAGGAGSLMCAIPNAGVVAHPDVASHLSNPALLWEKAVTVYGPEHTFHLYGRLVPVDESRIVHSHDGMELLLGRRILKLIDAPGHTNDHIVVWDEVSRSFFTGDAFGVSYREFDCGGRAFVFPATSPSEFNPEKMMTSIDRMVAHDPRAMFLTHYGRVSSVERLASDLFRLIHAQIAIAMSAPGNGVGRHVEILSGLEQLIREECARQRWALSEEISLNLLRADVSLNAQGLGMWLDHVQDMEALEASRAADRSRNSSREDT